MLLREEAAILIPLPKGEQKSFIEESFGRLAGKGFSASIALWLRVIDAR